jgi:predicted ATP-binding protein involved in virulence
MNINKISINGLWNAYDIDWTIDKKVTILSGINGSGKSTVLRAIGTLLKGEFLPKFMLHKLHRVAIYFDNDVRLESKIYHEPWESFKQKAEKDESIAFLVDQIEKDSDKKSNNPSNLDMRIEAQSVETYRGKKRINKDEFLNSVTSDFISTFDCAPKKPDDSNKSLEWVLNAQYSELDRHLDNVISKYKSYLIELSNSVTNMMSESSVTIESVREIFNSRNKLQDILDDFFSQTGKKVNREKGDLEFIFGIDGKSHPCSDLSAGEKQLVLILLTVFMQGGKPSILIMDEPEISLHVDWQQKLLERILNLNPNCQVIVSTHSPSMILDGWQSSVVNISTLSNRES